MSRYDDQSRPRGGHQGNFPYRQQDGQQDGQQGLGGYGYEDPAHGFGSRRDGERQGGGNAGGNFGRTDPNWGGQQGQPGQQGQHDPQQHFDPDYHQWRTEQLRNLDEDYRNWRQARYKKFSDEFTHWRKNRPISSDSSGGTMSGSSGEAGGQNAGSADITGTGGSSNPSRSGDTESTK